jgi:lipopolysaccharide/colanic/teichoic acid biosynthesis glycosyltransferase
MTAETGHERSALEGWRSAGLPGFTVVGAVALTAALLQIYAAMLSEGSILTLPSGQQIYVGLLVSCNLAVLLTAVIMSGSLERRLRLVMVVALSTHGVLGLTTMGLRLYYSRPTMFTAALVSLALGLTLATLMARWRPRRVGLILEGSPPEQLGWLRGGEAMARDADVRRYDLVVANFSEPLGGEWTSLISRALLVGCEVRHLLHYVEEVRGRVSVDHFSYEPRASTNLQAYRYAKRTGEVLLILLSLPVVLPLLAVSSLLIYMTMGGPVFFVQERVGLGGCIFRMLKLRTMVQSASAHSSATARSDARITPLGKVLRRLRIDELPQFWNILRGDMSLIGPRPEQKSLTANYIREMPAFHYRHVVRPGITGWAQVRGGYASNLSETRDKLAFDLYYVKYESFTLDMEILFRTVATLFSGNSAR